jgi:hypothetical protein
MREKSITLLFVVSGLVEVGHGTSAELGREGR